MQPTIASLTMRTLAICAALIGPGCTEEDLAPRGGRQAIVGGELDPDDPAVGLVYATDSEGQHGMTGVLVAPNKVLTGPSMSGSFTEAQFFVIGSDGSTVEHTYDAASAVTDPEFDAESPLDGYAVTVLTLQEPVPGAVATPLPLASAPPAAGQAVRVVGFGSTAGALSDSGTRREVATTITALQAGGVLFDYGDATHGGCFGDMGAPIFHAGASGEEIVGLAYIGTANCDGTSTATRIDASRAFIDEQVGPIEPAEPDAGVTAVDAGPADGGEEGGDDDDGGGCGVARGETDASWPIAVIGLVGLAARRRRPRRHPRLA